MSRIKKDIQDIKTMHGEQIRAARALLGWRVKDLAEAADVSVPTVQRMDAAKGAVPGRHDTVTSIKSALEAAGVQFLDNGDVSAGPGVAIRKNE